MRKEKVSLSARKKKERKKEGGIRKEKESLSAKR